MPAMLAARVKERWLLLGCGALVLLLLVIAWLQYQWIDRVSDAERAQRREFLESAIGNFRDEFVAAMQDPMPSFRRAPSIAPGTRLEPYLSSLLAQWKETARRPQLIEAVDVGTFDERDSSTFRRLGYDAEKFTDQLWPDSLSQYREILDKHLSLPGGEPPLFPRGRAFEFIGDRPVIVFPLVETPGPPRPGPREDGPPSRLPRREENENDRADQPPRPRPPSPPLIASEPREMVRAPQLRGWCFLEINLAYLQNQLIPELAERSFGRAGLDGYNVAVITSEPARLIYASAEGLTADGSSKADAKAVLFVSGMQIDQPPPPRLSNEVARRDRPPRVEGKGPPPPQRLGGQYLGPASMNGAWQIVLKHKSGSIEAVVNQARLKNLALSFGILIVLIVSIVVIAVAVGRARRLGRQQMEFVAGVSHELRTPLSVIHSASHNLAKGVVDDPRRVQQYGAMIENEVRRLTAQVEQVLSFAGIRSGRKYELRPTNVQAVVSEALSECAAMLEEAGWQSELKLEEDLPEVMADAAALESAIKNLIQNALKYAPGGKWLGVTVCASRNGSANEVQVSIADRGDGIDPQDLSRIFEPFYRGHKILGTSTAGAGLGLSLVQHHVKAHRGRVTVRNISGGGAQFTLHLPAIENDDLQVMKTL